MRIKKYRSKLEQKVARILGTAKWKYESIRIPYVLKKNYVPDFSKGNVYIEVKGFFRPGDQSKYLAVKESLDKEGKELVFIFSNPCKKVRKGAILSMSQWCNNKGFRWYNVKDTGLLKGIL